MLLLAALLLANHATTIEERVDSLLRQMTMDEKISLCHGDGSFNTAAIARLGIPSYKFSDGPSGVRYPWNQPSTCFANGVSIASTFDPALVHKVGVAIGEETLAKGNAVILGPGVNIVRTPIGGRSFEYYGEDPYLARQTAVAYIKGVQSRGVAACVKHFALNSIEMQRGTVDAQVDERTLREIYLPAFEGAVKDAKVLTVMAAYNKVNGQYCSENEMLQNQILKKEWGFQGYVMSDWGAVHSTVPAAMNGMDLEMPGGPRNFFAKPLDDAVKAGKVPDAVLDDKVRRFLRVMLTLDDEKPKSVPPVGAPQHLAVAQQVAEESMVLLKNDKGILPLSRRAAKNVLVIGPDADNRMCSGGGSVMVNAADEVTPLAGIRDYLGTSATASFMHGSEPDDADTTAIPSDCLQTEDGKRGLSARYFGPRSGFGQGGGNTPLVETIDPAVDFAWGKFAPADRMPAENYSVRWQGYLVPKESGTYFLGLKNDDGGTLSFDGHSLINNSDGWGTHPSVRMMKPVDLVAGKKYSIVVNYRQGEDPSEIRLLWSRADGGATGLIAKAAAAAKKADTVILVVGTNHTWDGEAHDKPNLGMFGDETELTEAVLKAQPNAVVTLVNGTAIEMPWIDGAHAVLEAWYGGSRAGTALARILFGEVDPSGKLPITFPVKLEDSSAHALGDYPPKDGVLKYDEGILVGYRWFDTKKVVPQFPFGFGLSYTTFDYGTLQLVKSGDRVAVHFKVRNAGKAKGSETAQVYVRAKDSTVPRAMQELKGFVRVSTNPGETADVTVVLPRSAFEYYSVEKKGWTLDPGKYEIAVGSSSRDIRLTGTIDLR